MTMMDTTTNSSMIVNPVVRCRFTPHIPLERIRPAVANPVPAVDDAFRKRRAAMGHRTAVHEEYHDLVGSIVMKLFAPKERREE